MFKLVLCIALLAFAAAKPLVVEYPVASVAAAYSAPVAVDYSAPVYYPGYATTYDYAAYAYPYSYYLR